MNNMKQFKPLIITFILLFAFAGFLTPTIIKDVKHNNSCIMASEIYRAAELFILNTSYSSGTFTIDEISNYLEPESLELNPTIYFKYDGEILKIYDSNKVENVVYIEKCYCALKGNSFKGYETLEQEKKSLQ